MDEDADGPSRSRRSMERRFAQEAVGVVRAAFSAAWPILCRTWEDGRNQQARSLAHRIERDLDALRSELDVSKGPG